MAGALFGDVGVSFFMAGAALVQRSTGVVLRSTGVVLCSIWYVGRVACRCDSDLPQLSRDSASFRTGCRMQLRAATKPTNTNFVRVIRKEGSIICDTGKWEAVVTNDSLGTRSSDLNTLYPLKLPTPPRAALMV